MTDDELRLEAEGLRAAFGETASAREPNDVILFRITRVVLPTGCTPANTPVLVRLQPGRERPEVFVKSGITLPNGVAPRNTSVVAVGGESLLQFSYSFAWDPKQHSLVQFVGAALRRFAKTE
jgi:hypothetical protein